MTLSESFNIDPNAPEITAHNAEVEAVTAAFAANKPERVPVVLSEWRGQHGFYAQSVGLDYRDYYTNPEIMVETQLESARYKREFAFTDTILGVPPREPWNVGVDLWPVAGPGAFGCPLQYFADDIIANKPLLLSKDECDAMEMPDFAMGGILKTVNEFYNYMVENYQGKLTYLGKTVTDIGHGSGTNGFFSLALDLRGQDIMADMYDDPAFVHRFLNKLADWCEDLCRFYAPDGQKDAPFGISDHGTEMLSAELYAEFILPVLLKKNAAYMETKFSFHHCGRGQQLFPVIIKNFRLSEVNALTFPLLNLECIREDIGEDVMMTVLLDNGITTFGTPDDVRYAVKSMLTPRLKGRGGLRVMAGDMLRSTNTENMYAMYDAVKEFGRY